MSIWKKLMPILTLAPVAYWILQSKKEVAPTKEPLTLDELFKFWKTKYQLEIQQNDTENTDILYQQAFQAKKETTTLDYYVQIHDALKKINTTKYQENALHAQYKDFTFIYEKDRISNLTIVHHYELINLTTFDTFFFEQCLKDLEQIYPLHWK